MSLKIAIVNTLLFSSTVLSNPLSRRQVGPDSKAGLAWPNGPYSDTEQYATTGKVSWCVYLTHTFCGTGPNHELQKVLHLEPKLYRYLS